MSDPEKSPMDEADARGTVDALLRAAGVAVPDEEAARLAGLYPALRRSVDRFYDVTTEDALPAARFDAGEMLGERSQR